MKLFGALILSLLLSPSFSFADELGESQISKRLPTNGMAVNSSAKLK